MRNRFDEQLVQLNTELIEMGAQCEAIISKVLKALLGDPAALSGVSELGSEIDRKERAIENLCLKLLLQQQPVARDLRQISAALKMITDMERIGDQAEDIAEIIPFLAYRPPQIDTLLDDMAAASIRMVTESVDAYVSRDLALARSVVASDDIVDDGFTRIKNALIADIVEHPLDSGCAIDLIMIAKYLERIGDHATNIAEWVIFAATGTHPEV